LLFQKFFFLCARSVHEIINVNNFFERQINFITKQRNFSRLFSGEFLGTFFDLWTTSTNLMRHIFNFAAAKILKQNKNFIGNRTKTKESWDSLAVENLYLFEILYIYHEIYAASLCMQKITFVNFQLMLLNWLTSGKFIIVILRSFWISKAFKCHFHAFIYKKLNCFNVFSTPHYANEAKP
jgi:hypothetical protein